MRKLRNEELETYVQILAGKASRLVVLPVRPWSSRPSAQWVGKEREGMRLWE